MVRWRNFCGGCPVFRTSVFCSPWGTVLTIFLLFLLANNIWFISIGNDSVFYFAVYLLLCTFHSTCDCCAWIGASHLTHKLPMLPATTAFCAWKYDMGIKHLSGLRTQHENYYSTYVKFSCARYVSFNLQANIYLVKNRKTASRDCLFAFIRCPCT